MEASADIGPYHEDKKLDTKQRQIKSLIKTSRGQKNNKVSHGSRPVDNRERWREVRVRTHCCEMLIKAYSRK